MLWNEAQKAQLLYTSMPWLHAAMYAQCEDHSLSSAMLSLCNHDRAEDGCCIPACPAVLTTARRRVRDRAWISVLALTLDCSASESPGTPSICCGVRKGLGETQPFEQVHYLVIEYVMRCMQCKVKWGEEIAPERVHGSCERAVLASKNIQEELWLGLGVCSYHTGVDLRCGLGTDSFAPGPGQVPGGAVVPASDGWFLNLCVYAGCRCPHTWPFGSLTAQRWLYLHCLFVHCWRLYRKHRILLPCFVARSFIAVAVCGSLGVFVIVWMTPFRPFPFSKSLCLLCHAVLWLWRVAGAVHEDLI